jgi:subtilase family serine protease
VQFTQQFGPTEQDYLKVIDFAQAHGPTVTGRQSSRAFLDVTGPVADIEKAFRVKLLVYRHPTENRTFYAPNTEPSVESDIPILHVIEHENSTLPQPLGLHFQARASAGGSNRGVTPYHATGSGRLACIWERISALLTHLG